MANIQTKKDDVILLSEPNPSNINVQSTAGAVVVSIKNDGVTHHCGLNPNEAIHMGVMLIQLAAQAHAADAQRKVMMVAQ